MAMALGISNETRSNSTPAGGGIPNVSGNFVNSGKQIEQCSSSKQIDFIIGDELSDTTVVAPDKTNPYW